MKITSLILTSLFLFSTVFAATTGEVNKLVNAKRYGDAAVATNELPLKKPADAKLVLDIFLDGHIYCIEGLSFVFKNLEPTETVESLRGKVKGDFTNVESPIEKIEAKFKNTSDAALLKRLGDFAMFTVECGNVIGADQKAKSYYERALAKGLAPDTTVFKNLAWIYNNESNFAKAVQLYKKAEKGFPRDPQFHYNFGFALYNLDKFSEALPHAIIAYEKYEDKKLKSEAALMVMELQEKLGKKDLAIAMAKNADEHKSKNYYYVYSNLLRFYLRNSLRSESENIVDRMFELDTKAPAIVQDIIKFHSQYSKRAEINAFFERQLIKQRSDAEAMGNLYYHHAGLIMKTTKDKAAAQNEFIKARDKFKSVLKPDHPVFEALEANLKSLN